MALKTKFKVRVSGDKFKVILWPEIVFKDNLTEQEAIEMAEKCNTLQEKLEKERACGAGKAKKG